jgi:hypothetical protein
LGLAGIRVCIGSGTLHELQVICAPLPYFSGVNTYYLSSSDPIRDLDWTSTPDSQSILAVGFRHHVEIYCQQRMTYFDDAHRWVVVCKIEVARSVASASVPHKGHPIYLSFSASFLPHHIADNTWLANGALLVSAGHHLLLYGRPKVKSDDSDLDLFGHVSRDNGPLRDYHPQMLLQCLLWGSLVIFIT